MVEKCFEFRSYARVINDFRLQFPNTNILSKNTMQRNVKMFSDHGEIHNRQKSNLSRSTSIGTQSIRSEVRYCMETCWQKGGRHVEGVVN